MPRRPPKHDIITSRRVPRARGTCPHGVRIQSDGRGALTLYIAGQIPTQPPIGTVYTGEMRTQARLAFANLRHVITDAGFTMDDVVQLRIHVTSLDHFDRIEDEYRKLFNGLAHPARTVVKVVGLLQGVGIEVDAVAIKGAGAKPAAAPGYPEEPPPEDMPIYGGGGGGSAVEPI